MAATVWLILSFSSCIVCGFDSYTVLFKCPQRLYESYCSNSNFHTVHTAHVPAPHNHSQHNQCRTPYEVVHSLVLLKMGIKMPKTCWGRSLIINIRLVASCWFLCPHPMFMMHGHKSLKCRMKIALRVSAVALFWGFYFTLSDRGCTSRQPTAVLEMISIDIMVSGSRNW